MRRPRKPIGSPLRRSASIVLAAALLVSSPVAARFLNHYNRDRKFLARGHSAPNETEPAKSLTVLAHATAGVYVSVGTERSFIGAAVTPPITHLLIIDYDSRVVSFARTNIALLEAAHDRAEYVRLRLSASFEDWVKAAAPGRVEPYLVPYMKQRARFTEFRETLKERGFEPLNDPKFADLNGEFKFVNYLYDDGLFARLSQLAKAGHVQAETLNLVQVDQVKELVDDLRREHLTISVLDLSNCWMEEYVPPPAFERAVAAFARATAPAGLLVLTNLSPDYAKRLPQLHDPAFQFHSDYAWSYYGFPLPPLSDPAASRRFAASLQRPAAEGGKGPGYLPGRVNTLPAP